MDRRAGAVARAAAKLRVPPSEFDALEVGRSTSSCARRCGCEKTARLVGRDATLAIAQRAEPTTTRAPSGTPLRRRSRPRHARTEAAEELRDAREVAARHEAGTLGARAAAAPRRCAPTRRPAAFRRRRRGEVDDADGAATALAVKDATALLERAAALRAAADAALPAEAERGYEAEEDEGAAEAAQLLASTRAVIAHAQFLERLSHGVE